MLLDGSMADLFGDVEVLGGMRRFMNGTDEGREESVSRGVPNGGVERQVIGRDGRIVDRGITLFLHDLVQRLEVRLVAVLGGPLRCRDFQHTSNLGQFSDIERP